MSSYTYPVRHLEGTLTAAQIHLLLSNKSVLAKRLATLVDQKFIADYLLKGRFTASGGGIYYETGEEIFTADAPEAIEPGGSYPKTIMTRGELAAARTVKWGQESDITDEKISREGRAVVDKALIRLANSIVKHVDSVAWGVIASKVAATSAVSGAWTSVGNIVKTLLKVQAELDDLALGLNATTIALSGASYAKIMGIFADGNVLPRENGNLFVSGTLPVNLLGYTWVTSPHVSGSDPWLLDTDQLGGMADETIVSPEFAVGPNGVEVASVRHKNEKYELKARRVTVPVVTEPLAGVKITGTTL